MLLNQKASFPPLGAPPLRCCGVLLLYGNYVFREIMSSTSFEMQLRAGERMDVLCF